MAKALEAYSAKRDFEITPEPSGLEDREVKSSEHFRFVIQKHDASRLHYDFRLELNGVFKSWAITRGPSLDPHEKRLAVEVEDHPLPYGDFEGTIPEREYGGGTVMIWDRGFWAPEFSDSPQTSIDKGELKFILAGSKLKGSWVLVRLKTKATDRQPNWLLIKHKDRWSTPGCDDIQEKDRSVASGRTLDAIRRGRGKPAEPFMTEGPAAGPAAIWNQKRAKRNWQLAQAATSPERIVTMPRLTHPGRVLWPGSCYDKQALAEYLLDVAPWMIDHIYGRPCSLLRAPEGIAGETFFQRHAMGMPGQPETVLIDREHEPYLQIDDAQTIAAMAQLSVIEFHPWNCAPFQPTVPGRLVFDLDPAPDVAFSTVIQAAKELKSRLTRLQLVPFCKTTGGKGLHVVTPLEPDTSCDWKQAKLFAQTLCSQMEADTPKGFTTNMAKAKRPGKIFLDYLRNTAKATAVAPLSPRARPGALVSMPLSWTQVRQGLDPSKFSIETVHRQLRSSLAWQDYADASRPLKGAIAKLIQTAK